MSWLIRRYGRCCASSSRLAAQCETARCSHATSCRGSSWVVEKREERAVSYDPSGYIRSVTFPEYVWLLGGATLHRHREHRHSLPRRDHAADRCHLRWDDAPLVHCPGDRGGCQRGDPGR